MRSAVLCVVFLLGTLRPSFGDSIVLFDELNAPTAGNDSISRFGPLSASFSTGASPGSLTDVMAKLTVTHDTANVAADSRNHRAGREALPVQPAASAGAGITVALFSDAGTRPGSLLLTIGSLQDTSLPGGNAYQDFDFPVSPPFPLSPNTRYWIQFSTTTASNAAVAWTHDTKGVGSANEFNIYNGQLFPNSAGPYQLTVTSSTSTTPTPTISNVFDQAAATSNLTPGMPIQVVGTGFGNSTSDSATVMIDNEAAPVLTFINSTNLIVQVPVDVALGAHNLTVTYKGQTSAAFKINVVAIAPEIEPFQSQNGSSFYDVNGNPITMAHPAIPGTEVYLLAIGLGSTNPAQVTNTVATAQAPTTQQVQVMVGNKMVQPIYSGLFVGGTPGFYQVSFIVPADAAMGNVPVTITVGGQTSNTQTLVVAPPIPVINAIVNGATFAPGPAPQAANSFVSLFGINFGTDNTTANIFPATTFKGLSVLVNGKAVPLYFVVGTGGQINIVLPSELGASGNATVEVKTAEGTSAPFQLALAADSVGIFRIQDPSNPKRMNGAVLFSNTAWKVMPLSMATALGLPNCSTVTTASICGKPAKAKDQIQIYLTGLGKATPNGDPNGKVLPTGSLAPTDGSVLYKTLETPVVKIGGVPAVVEFSGIAPGNAGQYQINVAVPDGVKPSDDVTLEITMPDGSKDTVTIAITAS